MTDVTISDDKLHDKFTHDHEYHYIQDDATAYSHDSKPALTSNNFIDLNLDNFGLIANDSGVAVLFTPHSTGEITNRYHADITGHDGLVIESTGMTMWNYGSILGEGLNIGNAGI